MDRASSVILQATLIEIGVYKHLESLPDTSSQIFLETLPDTLSLFLTGIRLSPKQARRVNNGYSFSLAERWTMTGIRRQSNSVLNYSLLTDVLPL